jgi:hypothetical protein
MSKHSLLALAAVCCLGCMSATSLADNRAYSQGSVVTVYSVRTVDGRFDDFMNWVDSRWKTVQEAAKKAGNILNYQVLRVEPRRPDDPDLLLVVTYKNWAALDDAVAKQDALIKKFEGSLAASREAQVDRANIRRVLGSATMQVLELK